MTRPVHLHINQCIIEGSNSPFLQKSLFAKVLHAAINQSLRETPKLREALGRTDLTNFHLARLPVLELDNEVLNNHYQLAKAVAQYINKALLNTYGNQL